jgi:hypothetical protein
MTKAHTLVVVAEFINVSDPLETHVFIVGNSCLQHDYLFLYIGENTLGVG